MVDNFGATSCCRQDRGLAEACIRLKFFRLQVTPPPAQGLVRVAPRQINAGCCIDIVHSDTIQMFCFEAYFFLFQK